MKRVHVKIGNLVDDSSSLEVLDFSEVERKLRDLLKPRLAKMFPRENVNITAVELEGRDEIGDFNLITVDGHRHDGAMKLLEQVLRDWESWWAEKTEAT